MYKARPRRDEADAGPLAGMRCRCRAGETGGVTGGGQAAPGQEAPGWMAGGRGAGGRRRPRGPYLHEEVGPGGGAPHHAVHHTDESLALTHLQRREERRVRTQAPARHRPNPQGRRLPGAPAPRLPAARPCRKGHAGTGAPRPRSRLRGGPGPGTLAQGPAVRWVSPASAPLPLLTPQRPPNGAAAKAGLPTFELKGAKLRKTT